jgi:hypothetical protein
MKFMMKFKFFNDTGRIVRIHPATFAHGCQSEKSPINPLEERLFILPTGSYPTVKMWDYGENIGLQILVSPNMEEVQLQQTSGIDCQKNQTRS